MKRRGFLKRLGIGVAATAAIASVDGLGSALARRIAEHPASVAVAHCNITTSAYSFHDIQALLDTIGQMREYV